MIDRIYLTKDYSISRVIKGGWQLAGGHGAIDSKQTIDDMFSFFDAGITTFDCADIYTGVEELIGSFRTELIKKRGVEAASQLQIHTKYVPDKSDLATITATDVRRSIKRSMSRLGVDRIDLVQFHWWDFSVDNYVQTAMVLADLQREGLIRHIGVTNFDTKHLDELLGAGVKIITNQVQYSVLDNRPEKTMQDYCWKHGIEMLCYGGLAGGFISHRYLDMPEVNIDDLAVNRSLIKYKLIIDDLGGMTRLHKLLQCLHKTGSFQGLAISEVALLYILSRPAVAATIVGARNKNHLVSLKKLASHKLSKDDLKQIDYEVHRGKQLAGDIYHLERYTPRHANIMKYHLNKNKEKEMK